MYNEHIIDYVDMVLLGDVRCELDAHVQAYRRQEDRNTQMWDSANEVWWQL
jgi:hypothetical protein